MLEKVKDNILSIELSLGFFIYIILLIQSTLSLAVLWGMFIVYLWLISSVALKKYNFTTFIYVICGSGIAISISFFFLQGVEELAFPEGALMFHVDGIAKSFCLFFICTIPLILLSNSNAKSNQTIKLSEEDRDSPAPSMWEEATPEDLESGNYEPL